MSKSLHLFEAYGIELEYMIVDQAKLNVKPICDRILNAVAGDFVNEVTQGATSWSNELALHIIETKVTRPAPDLKPYVAHFHQDVRQINTLLADHGAQLMPTAMHPLMNPGQETRLWPHEQTEIYNQFNQIFNCKGHGWSNLQSTHINLPFCGDEELKLLHRAIRLLMPIMPGLTASSPFVEGRATGAADSRLGFYAINCRRVPSITALVIPEDITSAAGYRQQILEPMYRDIKPLDPQGILAQEWLNARGAITRFDRGAIEIRILDIQEAPRADLAYATLIIQTLKALVAGKMGAVEAMANLPLDRLVAVYQTAVRDGHYAAVSDEDYLAHLGWNHGPTDVGRLWQYLAEQTVQDPFWQAELQPLLEAGTLADRIFKAVGASYPSRDRLAGVYADLMTCLAENRRFGC